MLTQAMGTLHSCSGIRLDVKAVAKAYSQGAIALADADLVLVDLNTYPALSCEELLTKCGWVLLKAGT